MPECGNVTSSVRALGIDIGSTHAKAVVVCVGDTVHELAVARRAVSGLDGAGLVAAALDAAAEAIRAAGGPIAVVGIASMAETGAVVDAEGTAGPLVRWDREGDPAARLALARGLDPELLHAATGAPLVPKLPLLAWAALVHDGLPHGARWGFAADLVAAALTGRIATDHTLAGRSGAFPLPAPGVALGTQWDAELLAAVGVPKSLPPAILAPGESAGPVREGVLTGATGAPVYIAGHDHAVAARLAGADRPGSVVHSLGTTEAVIALAPEGSPVVRHRAGREGISVVRSVDGAQEGVLAGNPSAGALIAAWRERAAAGGADPDALLRARPGDAGSALALPYPRGRQSPAPDPAAAYSLQGAAPGDPGDELTGILRGLAAHGAWMRAVVAELASAGPHPAVAAVGAPVRDNRRLAGLMAGLTGAPLRIVDLDAPVATGAAAIAAERAGLCAVPPPPFRLAEPDGDGMPDLAERFALAVTTTVTEGAP
jgi:sugar (pentulose or hexulose) kinase